MKSKSLYILLGLVVLVLGISSPLFIGTVHAQSSGVAILPGNLTQTLMNQYPAGTTFVLMPGVHRQASIRPRSGDVIEGMAGAVMNGSKVLNQFSFDGQFWVAPGQTQQGTVLNREDWSQSFCEAGYDRCIYPEELFFDNQPLRHATSLSQLSPGMWFFDYAADKIYLADNPAGHLVETAVQSYAIGAGGGNVTIRNLTVEKYATPAQLGAIQAGGTSGWRIENVTVQLNHAFGVKIGNNMQVLNSRFLTNGQVGIGGQGNDTLVEGSEMAFNNFARFNLSWEAGGTKFVRTRNLTLRNNYAHDNYATGLWTDIDNVDSLIENNLVVRNSRHGIFHEISYAAIIRNNVSMYNGFGSTQNQNGAQILIATSRDVQVYGNRVVVNTGGGHGVRITRGSTAGSGALGPHTSVNDQVNNNRIVHIGSNGRSGFSVEGNPGGNVWQESNNAFNQNAYYVPNSNTRYWEWGGSQINWPGMQSWGQEMNGRMEVFASPPADLVSIPQWDGNQGAQPTPTSVPPPTLVPTATETPVPTLTETPLPTETATNTDAPLESPTPTPDLPSGPALFVDVIPMTASPGDTVSVALNLVNVTDVYGLQARCVVDSAVLSGIGHAEGDGFGPSPNSFFVDRGYQPDGSWLVAATRLEPAEPISGNATAYSLLYTVQNAGSSAVTCSALAMNQDGHELPLTVINGSFNGAPTEPTATTEPTGEATLTLEPTLTETPTEIPTTEPTLTEAPTVEPTLTETPTAEATVEPTLPAGQSTVSGTAAYQNRPDNAGITVALVSLDGTPIAETVTAADGAFSFNAAPLGVHTLRLSAPQHLTVERAVIVETDGQVIGFENTVLPAGDADSNGLIDVLDATLIGANFDVAVPPAPADADLNGDGLVNLADLVLMGGNFGLTSPVVLE